MPGTGGPTSSPKPTWRPPRCTASQPVLRARLSWDPPSLWLPGPGLLSATLVTTSSPLLPFSDLLPLTSGGPGLRLGPGPLPPQPLPLIPSFSRTLKPSHGLILFALPPEFTQSLGPSPLLCPPGPSPLSSHLDLQTDSRPLPICSQTAARALGSKSHQGPPLHKTQSSLERGEAERPCLASPGRGSAVGPPTLPPASRGPPPALALHSIPLAPTDPALSSVWSPPLTSTSLTSFKSLLRCHLLAGPPLQLGRRLAPPAFWGGSTPISPGAPPQTLQGAQRAGLPPSTRTWRNQVPAT